MAHFLIPFLIIISHTVLILVAESSRIEPTTIKPMSLSPSSNDHYIQIVGQPSKSRKLGKHHVVESEPPTTASPSNHEENVETSTTETGTYLEKHHQHHSVGKSVAGGGVIIGGLVMAFVVSIVCYIRATRRRSMVEPPTPSTSRSGSS